MILNNELTLSSNKTLRKQWEKGEKSVEKS